MDTLEKVATSINKANGLSNSDNDPITHMPLFKRTITVEVEMDEIYKKLLDLLPENFKHREVLAHAMVGSAVGSGTIAYIYKPLNGFTNDIDFAVGNIVVCSSLEGFERYGSNFEDENGMSSTDQAARKVTTTQELDYKPKWAYRRVPIGRCEVVEVNLYAEKKLKIRYRTWDKWSHKETEIEGVVDHRSCSRTE